MSHAGFAGTAAAAKPSVPREKKTLKAETVQAALVRLHRVATRVIGGQHAAAESPASEALHPCAALAEPGCALLVESLCC